jgi:putative ABC transport system permease protein
MTAWWRARTWAACLGLAGPLALAAPPAQGQTVPVALERRLAERLNLGVGDTLNLGTRPDSMTRTGVVTAIYEPAADPASITHRDLSLRLHLPDLAELLGGRDRVDRLGVMLLPGRDPDSAAARFNQLAFGFRAHSSSAIASGSSQTFRVVSRFHRAIAVISIVASAVFLLCIMLLKVEERRRDAAVMRLIGIRRRTIFGALVLEAMAVALIGSIAGVLLALAAGAVTNLYYRRLFDTALIFSRVTPDIILFSVALSLLLGIAAGILAAYRLVRTPPLVLWGRA